MNIVNQSVFEVAKLLEMCFITEVLLSRRPALPSRPSPARGKFSESALRGFWRQQPEASVRSFGKLVVIGN